RTGGPRSRWRAAGLRRARTGHAERHLPARAAVPQSRVRLIRAQCLSLVAAVRPSERTIRAGDAGRMAWLDHGGRPRQISRRALRRRAPSRTRGNVANTPRGAAGDSAGRSYRHRRFEALRLRDIEKMPPCPVLGLDDPGVGIEAEPLGTAFFPVWSR